MTQDNGYKGNEKISLSVSVNELEKFCSKLIKRSRDITKTHDSLSTLEAFLTVFGKSEHGSNEYRVVEEVLKSFSEKTRQQLLDEKNKLLLNGLKKCSVGLITDVHVPLSRSGFHQVLEIAVSRLTQQELTKLVSWTNDWVNEARKRAEQASDYPDALDFKKADIKLEEYQAMFDMNNFLGTL